MLKKETFDSPKAGWMAPDGTFFATQYVNNPTQSIDWMGLGEIKNKAMLWPLFSRARLISLAG